MTDEPQGPSRPAELLLLGVWVGMLAGLAEGSVQLVLRFGLHRLVFHGADMIWMAPVSLAMVCGLAALPLAAIARSAWGTHYPSLPFLVLGSLGCFAAVPAIPGVHPIARLTLLAGLAAGSARLVTRHSVAALRFVRRSAPALVTLVALLAVGIPGSRCLRERRALHALPQPAGDAPNVLIVVLDAVRAMDLSLYGYERPTTPALERLARRAIVYRHAYAPSSWTLPTHAALFTGHWPAETGVSWRVPLDRRYPTLAETFQQRGYATAGFSANPFYVTRASGLARGFAHFEDHLIAPRTLLTASSLASAIAAPLRRLLGSYRPLEHKSAQEVREAALRWLSGRDSRHPFFVFMNWFDAHAPYLPPPPYDTSFTGRRASWDQRNLALEAPRPVTPAQAAGERDAYDQAVAAQDHQLGLLLEQLEQRGLLHNTLLVVTSDHGEEFGEYGLLSHGNSLNPAVLWVPLVIALPGSPAPSSRPDAPVSLVDLAATILTLADPSQASALPGIPLWRREPIDGPEPGSPAVGELEYAPDTPAWLPHGPGPLRSVTTAEWHYLQESGGKETLLSIGSNPAGRAADPGSPEARAVLPLLRAVLDSLGRARSGQ